MSWVEQTAVWGVTLSAEQVAQFDVYLRLLVEWNGRMNLTAVREPAEMERRHFLDALSCAQVTGDMNGRCLIDVGSGAGFPGLPLKIAYPQMALTLVESVGKKAHFLQVVVQELGLTAVQIVSERAEVVGQDGAHRGQYDWAVARAVAEMRVLVEYLLPLCRVGGHLLAQKGENAVAETAAAVAAIGLCGGGAPQLTGVRLPGHEPCHYLVVIPKVAETPPHLPRRVGLPVKRPL
jgi:16S rRNA (guanine527-N7)-methyltransferase